jgi:hypothetical protein
VPFQDVPKDCIRDHPLTACTDQPRRDWQSGSCTCLSAQRTTRTMSINVRRAESIDCVETGPHATGHQVLRVRTIAATTRKPFPPPYNPRSGR